DEVMAHAGDVGGKIGGYLREALEQLPLSRDLVTIRTDVALPLAPTELVLRERDADTLRTLFTRYGFTQALRELDGNGAGPQVTEKEPSKARGNAYAIAITQPAKTLDPALAAPGEYETILTAPALAAWIERLQQASLIAFDTETD